MKIAVSSTGDDLGAQIDPRFGRCAYFIIVDTEDMAFEAYDNENRALSGGAGIQAAGFVADKGAEAVLTGHCGPNAMTAFDAVKIPVYAGQSGTVAEAVRRFSAGKLQVTTRPTVAEKAGASGAFGRGVFPGGGMGRCRSGGGRGMGMGRMSGGGGGMGMGRKVLDAGGTAPDSVSQEESLAALKREAEDLRRRMAAIQEKIDRLE